MHKTNVELEPYFFSFACIK